MNTIGNPSSENPGLPEKQTAKSPETVPALPKTAYQSGAKVLPPVVYAVVFAAGLLLQHFFPVAMPTKLLRGLVTLLCMCISGWLALWSFFSFWRARTSPMPTTPSAALVTAGPYRFVRNPMYVSLAFLYAGLAFWYEVFWALPLLPIVFVLVRYLVLAGEERYLERKFGDAYLRYKERVPRWIPRLRR